MDDEEILAFIEAVDGADFHAIGVFALDAIVGHDIGHEELQDFPCGWDRATWNVAPIPVPDEAWTGLGGKHASGRLSVTYRLYRRISRINDLQKPPLLTEFSNPRPTSACRSRVFPFWSAGRPRSRGSPARKG
ncbi:hypothetical protein RHECNPAF_280065 [Rhizobium etli CNPAF512]|nr:hypothetical protein RHECNPAF_280065 [Rhizobium etli CNPAF512]